MPLTEEQKAALAKQRGAASAKIVDPDKKKAYIARQGNAEAKGKDSDADYAKLQKEADETTATDAENINTGGMPHYSKGTESVPATGPAVVHKGEKIVPADQNPDNKFSLAQQSEDTERDMMGKPQKFGAAMPDDGDAGLTPGATDAPPAGDAVSLEHPTVTELKKQNAELEQRIADLEAQVGKKPAGPADQGMEYDEHGEEY